MMSLMVHMIVLLLPLIEIQVADNQWVRDMCKIISLLWPFPTFKMLSMGNLYIRQLLMKSLEICVIALYAIDLLPKIFLWR